MIRYRKKPVVIEAVQFTGKNFDEVMAFCPTAMWRVDKPLSGLTIPTLEGDHLASPGDFIIKGVNGEFYPCKPDIFEKTYALVDDDDSKTVVVHGHQC
jgi:hypothetical protein